MKTIGLIDFSHALRVNYHVRAPDGGPSQAGEATLSQLSDWRRGLDHVIVCLDSPPYDRSKAYEAYKAQRERDDGYIAVCKWTKQRLVADGYSIASHPGAEADDVIATLAHRMLAPDVRIFGGDKDCLQCVDGGDGTGCVVRVFCRGRTGEWEIRDEDWILQRYGITPDQVPLFLAICGDASDNIPGIKGIGEKGAAKLIQEFQTIPKMRMAAVAALEESQKEGAKPLKAFWKNFLEGSPQLPDWLALTTLRTDLPLDIEALLTKQPIKPLVTTPENIEHGDAWEPPSAEELQEEREMLDPEAIISRPKAVPVTSAATSAPPGGAVTARANEAETELPKPVCASAKSSDTHARSAKSPDASETSESVSVVVDRPVPPSWALALQPASANQALQIAKTLISSRFFANYGTPEGLYAVISLGRELGLGMMQALQGFHIVQDKPFAKWQTLLALAESDPNCEWIMCTESTDERCTWRTKHRKRPEPESYTYDRAEAQRNGCYTGSNKHNWNARERQMLRKTCLANAVRIWYSGRTSGLYIPEEMND